MTVHCNVCCVCSLCCLQLSGKDLTPSYIQQHKQQPATSKCWRRLWAIVSWNQQLRRIGYGSYVENVRTMSWVPKPPRTSNGWWETQWNLWSELHVYTCRLYHMVYSLSCILYLSLKNAGSTSIDTDLLRLVRWHSITVASSLIMMTCYHRP